MKKKKPRKDRPGPEPARLKLDGDWEIKAGDAMKKKRPAEGWPKPETNRGRGR